MAIVYLYHLELKYVLVSDFWQKLKKPFFALAPMDDVTDTVFRQIVASVAAPDVFFTEFTNVDGLMSAGREKLLRKLKFTEKERPIIAQIWGMKPENYFEVAKQIVVMGFDGIDINMGCPERAVLKAGACAALINNRGLVKEIIQATKEGARDLPISVKTRLGLRQIQTVDWITFLLEQRLDALTVHGRTAAEMSKVPAHWDEIGKVVNIRDSMGVDTVIIGNGDVQDVGGGLLHVEKYGVDGIMIGRGVFNNVAVFSDGRLAREEKLKLLIKHTKLFEKTWEKNKNPQIMKKFFKVYANGFAGAGQLRERLMAAGSYGEIYTEVANFLKNKLL